MELDACTLEELKRIAAEKKELRMDRYQQMLDLNFFEDSDIEYAHGRGEAYQEIEDMIKEWLS